MSPTAARQLVRQQLPLRLTKVALGQRLRLPPGDWRGSSAYSRWYAAAADAAAPSKPADTEVARDAASSSSSSPARSKTAAAGDSAAPASEAAGAAADKPAAWSGRPGERLTLKLLPRRTPRRGGDARVLERHVPWIFNDEVANVSTLRKAGKSALLVDVVSEEGRELGSAVCNLLWRKKPLTIVARMLTDNVNDDIDSAFFEGILRSALQAREAAFGKDAAFYRLLNAEGDHLPGVICDRFGDILCLQFTAFAMEALFEKELLDALESVLSPRAIVIRGDMKSDRSIEGAPRVSPRVARGKLSGAVAVESKDGFKLAFDLLTPDGMAPAHCFQERRLRQVLAESLLSRPAAKRKILSMHGESLGVYCAMETGGEVTYLESASFHGVSHKEAAAVEEAAEDDDKAARAAAEAQGKLRAEELARRLGVWRNMVQAVAAGNACSERLKFIGAPDDGDPSAAGLPKECINAFDVVLMQPPALAPTREQREVGAERYKVWAEAAATAAGANALLAVTCRSRAMSVVKLTRALNQGIWAAGRRAQLLHRWSGAGHVDFPVHMGLLDTQGLYTMIFRLS
eukprot:TRINITY_DN51307_c0_g1_i1.p1 TRINITY_DN51307_c0_g1~~TRINITY_DN51307_c0_g1_i1.p1  ORF type:complete len:573 (+),score=150.36 TRINITY_DN51307_c0_g1_i1:87-1805(+)